MTKIKKGQKVTFICSSFLKDGTSLDDPEDNEPMTMTAGASNENQFAAAISKALIGMEPGKDKKVTLKPKDAFGEVNQSKVVKIPIADLPSGVTKGDVVSMETEEGSEDATVVSMTAKAATLDFNHPLAGHPIILQIKVLKVAKSN